MKGILVNYEYCTGCHSCEVACKKHLDLKEGEFGIKVSEVGPIEFVDAPPTLGKERWDWFYVPALTQACNLCVDRVGRNKLPMCVQHCQAFCLEYGDVEELSKLIDDKGRYALLVKPI